MNKIIILSLLWSASVLTACQSPKTSKPVSVKKKAHWQGVYIGNLPCSSCEGIESRVSLYEQGLFTKTDTYIGEKDGKFTENGEVQWNANKNKVSLVSDANTSVYLLKDNTLILLGADGQPATGALAQNYVLTKQ